MCDWPTALAVINGIKAEMNGEDQTPIARVAKDLQKVMYGKR